jgi:hypothetical protein
MSDKPPKLPQLGFAGFEASSAAAGHGRRRSRWALRPMREPSEGEAVDASRFVKEADLCAGLGRKPVKE